jgi:trans-2-enoyl-CoA reductase
MKRLQIGRILLHRSSQIINNNNNVGNNVGNNVYNVFRTYSTLPKETLAAVYHQHGNARNVVKLENIPLPNSLKPNEVLVKMLAAPINPADINMIEGTYGASPKSFPAVGGNEGVGVVQQVGSNVHGLKVNQRVIPAKAGFGTWRQYAVASEDDLQAVPDNIPVEYSATISVNPCTAYRLLNDFAQLKPGDVVVQNGANSAVGLSVIQLAKLRGLKTVNIIRTPRPDEKHIIEKLKLLGGDIVVAETYANTAKMKELVSDLPKGKLGLNAVGGESARAVVRFLGDDAQFVTYGGMSRKPIMLPTAPFIFNNLTARGFWLTKWVEKASKSDREKMLNELNDLIAKEKFVLFLENQRFSDFDNALEKTFEPYRTRKIVLKF